MLKPALQLKLGQQLTMTPQLQQAIKLLQLPVLELQAQVQQALETNVMLEAEEDEAVELTSLDQPSPARPKPTAADEEAADRRATPKKKSSSRWPTRGRTAPRLPANGRAQDDDDRPLEFADERGRDLHQHLIWQLEISKLDPRQVWIGEAIIDALNDDGYLTETARGDRRAT